VGIRSNVGDVEDLIGEGDARGPFAEGADGMESEAPDRELGGASGSADAGSRVAGSDEQGHREQKRGSGSPHGRDLLSGGHATAPPAAPALYARRRSVATGREALLG